MFFSTNLIVQPILHIPILGHTRTLSNVLAHELTHVLIENKWLLKSKREYFNKDSSLEFGLWKEEGYAEYVAGGSSISLDDGLKMLNNEVAIEICSSV